MIHIDDTLLRGGSPPHTNWKKSLKLKVAVAVCSAEAGKKRGEGGGGVFPGTYPYNRTKKLSIVQVRVIPQKQKYGAGDALTACR